MFSVFPFPDLLTERSRLWLGLFKCVPAGVFRLLTSSAPSQGIYEAERKPRGITCHFLSPKIHSWLFTLPSRLLCLFNVPCLTFLAVLSRRNSEKYNYSFLLSRSRVSLFYLECLFINRYNSI